MRKKIMATILGKAMLLTAVSLQVVEDQSRILQVRRRRNHKRNKRDEKIEIKILSKYDQIKNYFKISERNDGRRYIISGNCGN